MRDFGFTFGRGRRVALGSREGVVPTRLLRCMLDGDNASWLSGGRRVVVEKIAV